MFTTDNGLMIRPKEREFTFIKMVLRTQANGKMTNSMDMVSKNGQTEHNTKEALSMD